MRFGVQHTVLMPIRCKFEQARHFEITEEDSHPTKDEINNSYGNVRNSTVLRCGDIIRLNSDKYQYTKYYFLAQDGLELIET